MLKLNSRIHKLENVELLALQKCLLPETNVDSLIPGTWIKCVTDNGYAYICQAYLRNIPSNVCFLDQSVISYNDGNTKYNKSSMEHMQTIEVLEYQNNVITSIKLIFVLNNKFFANNKMKLTRELLIQKSLPILLTYTVCNNCSIRTAELQHFGINEIQIKSNTSANACFNISTATKLHIEDVQMLQADKGLPIHPSILSVYKQSYEQLLTLLLQSSRNALITGVSGVGKSSLVKAFLQQQNCNYFNITAGSVIGQYPGETQLQLREIFLAAQEFVQKFKPKTATVIFIEDIHLLCPATADANSARICAQLLQLLDNLQAKKVQIMCLATSISGTALSAQTRRPGRFEMELELLAPNILQRKQLFASMWQEQLGEQEVLLTDSLLQQIEQHTHGYVASDLELLVRKVSDAYWRSNRQEFCVKTALMNALQNIQPNALSSAEVSTYKMTEGLSSIGGMLDLKRLLQIHVLQRLNNNANYARFGLKMSKGILLYGPPGCAKTSVAKCLAAEANMTFIATSGAEVYSPYVGCAERFIAKLFDTARKNAPCIIFLDEIDTLVGRRTNSNSGSNDVQMRILATLLTEMDGIVSGDNTKTQILVVAATNRPDMVDEALLRPGRFDKLIHVPAPDMSSRLAILELHAKRMPFNTNVNLEQLAEYTNYYSGADICNLCNEAALSALQRNLETTEICMEDFEHVLQESRSSLDQQIIDGYIRYEQGQSFNNEIVC